MKHAKPIAIAALCASFMAVPFAAGAHSADKDGLTFNPAGLPFSAGTYRCELNRKVDVRHVANDLQSAVLHWDRRDYTMRAVNTASGALRYEDAASGLVWIVIVGKSMLLDTKLGRQLANECKA